MLLYFILGSLFTELVLPCLTSLAEVLMTLLETVKAKFSLTITEYNKKISKLAKDMNTEKEKKKNPIGFLSSAISDVEIEPEDDDEDEEYEDD